VGFRYDHVTHHAPVFHGDTLFVESEVVRKRESKSRSSAGIVTTRLRAFNQDDEKVLSLKRTNLMLKREYAQPSAAKPRGGLQTSALSQTLSSELPAISGRFRKRQEPCSSFLTAVIPFLSDTD